MKANFNRWMGRAPDVSAVLSRFPIPAVIMAIFTLLWIFKNAFPDTESVVRTMASLVVAGYVCVSIILSAEARGKAPNLVLQLVIFALAAALGWFSEALRITLPMAVGAAILVLGNRVRAGRGRNDLHVWDFTHKLWTGAAFATLGSIIFTLGLIFITEAVKTLFGLRLNALVEDLLMPIGLGLLAPLYWLSTLPSVDEPYEELYENPGFVSTAVAFLGTWLLAPLTLIFAVILVAYGVKIIIAGTLPQGEIATMTLPFLIIGTLTWLVLEPPFITKKALANLFRRAWWPLAIPASLLLAIAVFVRIGEYGYTPQRFALSIGVVWALGLSLWFSFGPKAKRDIRLIPGSAAALLIIGTLGAGWLSVSNQALRLEQSLKQAGIMSADGALISPVSVSDKDAARKAKGALRYLLRHDEQDRVAAVLAATGIATTPDNTPDPDMMYPDKDHLADIETALGLDKVSVNNRWSQTDQIQYYRDSHPFDIAGFDTMTGPFSLYYSDTPRSLSSQSNLDISSDGTVLRFSQDGEDLATFDALAWIKAQGFDLGTVTTNIPNISVLDDNGRKITLVINAFNTWREDDEAAAKDKINMDFYVLTQGFTP